MKRIALLVGACVFSLVVQSARAGSDLEATTQPSPTPLPEFDPGYHRGAMQVQLEEGFEISIQHTHPRVNHFDYELTVLRFGYMLDSPHGENFLGKYNFLRGNDEIMLGAEGGPIIRSNGTALGGITAGYRRNFMSPGAWLVPYLNLGAGVIYSDTYHNRVQRQLGEAIEFIPQAEFGLHYRVTPKWSLDAEFAYRHISDAFITRRNLGTNGVGGSFGISRSF